MIGRLRWWLVEQKALVRMLDDAHRALKIAHASNRLLVEQVRELEANGACPGRVEHIRLAHRVEQAEALHEQRIAPGEVLTVVRVQEGRHDG